MRFLTITLITLSLLIGCAKPTTVIPASTQQEVLLEQQQQTKIAKQGSKAAATAKAPTTQQLNEAKQRLAHIAPAIAKAGAQLCQQLFGLPLSECSYNFKVEADKTINAYADGKNVVVTTGMDFANKDDELALVLSHEVAHNIMGHIQKSKKNSVLGGATGLLLDVLAASQGIDTGAEFTKKGMQVGALRFSSEFEKEADYVGLYITAIAKYPIDNAPSFWRKMSVNSPNAIYISTSHPTNPERYLLLEKTVAEIKQKQKNGVVLQPQIQIEK